MTAGMFSTASGAQLSESSLYDVIPAPVSVEPASGEQYRLTGHTSIHIDKQASSAKRVANRLRELLRPATGFALPIKHDAAKYEGEDETGGISLRLDGSRAELGRAGYRLRIDDDSVTIRATTGDGLFNGMQTLRQLLPATIESDSERSGPWTIPGGEITDRPRFEHRAAMLDVARHFHGVDSVKRYIDHLALYKVNYLHLHLSDDQGWRIQIDSWPRLTTHGGDTEVGGTPGGYYTKQEYGEIVDYAAARNVTIVPEIDLPGHTNAALSSYDKLNCDGTAPPPYTGIEVGFSSLCIDEPVTYRFVEDVIREVAAMTPGPYLHIGGDEAHSTSEADYKKFMSRVLPLVEKYGKTAVGWSEYAKATPPKGSVVQYWHTENSAPEMVEAAANGNKILMSPANKAYIDMKYNEDTELGLDWAGYSTVRDSYRWDPATFLPDVPDEAILGVEAPMWTETLANLDQVEFMAFPRLPGIAEIGWSPASKHDWQAYRQRLAAQAPRWEQLGIDYYRSPQVPWPGN